MTESSALCSVGVSVLEAKEGECVEVGDGVGGYELEFVFPSDFEISISAGLHCYIYCRRSRPRHQTDI
jgi:hypothetical protein